GAQRRGRARPEREGKGGPAGGAPQTGGSGRGPRPPRQRGRGGRGGRCRGPRASGRLRVGRARCGGRRPAGERPPGPILSGRVRGSESERTSAPAWTSRGGTPCERSITFASGAILSITAWQIPTHSLRYPKSERKMIELAMDPYAKLYAWQKWLQDCSAPAGLAQEQVRLAPPVRRDSSRRASFAVPSARAPWAGCGRSSSGSSSASW